MRRSRITLLCAFALGSLVTLVALPIAFSSRGSQRDLAGEAQAAPVASPAAALAEPPAVPASSGQLTPLPSLAPLVKQLRPVVVNINSRFKPRRATAQQRRSLPQARPRQPFDQRRPADRPRPDQRAAWLRCGKVKCQRAGRPRPSDPVENIAAAHTRPADATCLASVYDTAGAG